MPPTLKEPVGAQVMNFSMTGQADLDYDLSMQWGHPKVGVGSSVLSTHVGAPMTACTFWHLARPRDRMNPRRIDSTTGFVRSAVSCAGLCLGSAMGPILDAKRYANEASPARLAGAMGSHWTTSCG